VGTGSNACGTGYRIGDYRPGVDGGGVSKELHKKCLKETSTLPSSAEKNTDKRKREKRKILRGRDRSVDGGKRRGNLP